jgi:hypothetical protein
VGETSVREVGTVVVSGRSMRSANDATTTGMGAAVGTGRTASQDAACIPSAPSSECTGAPSAWLCDGRAQTCASATTNAIMRSSQLARRDFIRRERICRLRGVSSKRVKPAVAALIHQLTRP